MFKTSFVVYVDPIGKGRPKFRRVGNFVSTYTPKDTTAQEIVIASAAQFTMNGQEPLETPLTVYITFYMPVPKSYSKKRTEACLNGSEAHTKKPDLDNMAKLVLDAMNGIVYKDDSQITRLNIHKKYSHQPNIQVAIVEDVL